MKRTKKRTWEQPQGIDPEVVELCRALNRLPGIETVESCSGHGSMPLRVWFMAEHPNYLPPALYFFDW